MRTLKQTDVLRIMREEWDIKLASLMETVDVVMKAKIPGDKEEKPVLSAELKVVHKKSGIRYTVSSVGPRDVILRTPEGEEFIVDAETMENEYEIA